MKTTSAPHIPPDEHVKPPAPRPATAYFVSMVVIGALSGFVASIFYAAYGPTPTQKFETRVEQTPAGIDERLVMNAQESVGAVLGGDAQVFATAITSDGWFVGDVRAARGKKILLRGQGALPIEKIVVDSATGLVFLKTHAQNVRVLDDEALADAARGSRVFAVTQTTAVPLTFQDRALCIADHCPSEYADQLSYAGAFVEAVAPHTIDGAPVISLHGALLGFATTQNNKIAIVPVDVVKPLFQSVFTSGTITRASLGLRVLNTVRVPADMPPGTPAGMLVENFRTTHPAYDLKDGDIITAIAGQRVQADTQLFAIVQQAATEKTLHVTVMRAGKQLEITLPLLTKNFK